MITPTALWLSLRYAPALKTLHLNSDPPSPADGLISYPVGRRTTKLTQLMPCDRSSVRDRRGDCQRLLPPARRDARNAVLREPDSALLPGPSPIGAARGVDGGTRGACRRPLPGPAVCFNLRAPVHGRAGSGLCDKPAALAGCFVHVDLMGQTDLRAVGAMKASLHPPALGLTWPSSSRSRRRTAMGVCFRMFRGGARRPATPSEMQKRPSAQTWVLRRRRTNK